MLCDSGCLYALEISFDKGCFEVASRTLIILSNGYFTLVCQARACRYLSCIDQVQGGHQLTDELDNREVVVVDCQVQEVQVLRLDGLVTHVDLIHFACDVKDIHPVGRQEFLDYIHIPRNAGIEQLGLKLIG